MGGIREKILADYIANKGIQNEKLRDEIFCQLANQTWKNENEANCERGKFFWGEGDMTIFDLNKTRKYPLCGYILFGVKLYTHFHRPRQSVDKRYIRIPSTFINNLRGDKYSVV